MTSSKRDILRSAAGRCIQGVCISIFTLFFATYAYAVQPDEILEDPALEDRAREISKELRCLVCQNQSIDDSNAELARDLRVIVRERLTEGDSDTEVLDFVVARYGDYVLLRPPMKPETYALWFGPAVVVVLGVIGMVVFLRNRAQENTAVAGTSGGAGNSGPSGGQKLSDEEQSRLNRLLNEESDAGKNG